LIDETPLSFEFKFAASGNSALGLVLGVAAVKVPSSKVPSSNAPVRYMERTRLYYRALGYEQDYVWATFDEVPFTRLTKPLSEVTLALLTTIMPPDLADRNSEGQGGRVTWARNAETLPVRMSTDHLAWDKESTHTRDRDSYLPIEAVRRHIADGLIGGLARRVYGIPTLYSQRKSIEQIAPEVFGLIKKDGADAALLPAL
jgi:hypothetical protein